MVNLVFIILAEIREVSYETLLDWEHFWEYKTVYLLFPARKINSLRLVLYSEVGGGGGGGGELKM